MIPIIFFAVAMYFFGAAIVAIAPVVLTLLALVVAVPLTVLGKLFGQNQG